MAQAYYFGGFKLEPQPDLMTFDQATLGPTVHHIARSYREYELAALKRNARVYLAQGNLYRAINQTRLALITYQEMNK